MPTLPNLNSLGKLCSSNRSHSVDRVRVKRKSSVKRMSIIEDGHVAEVLYLIPKQYMEQLPFLNPNEYYLSERLNEVATGRTGAKTHVFTHLLQPSIPAVTAYNTTTPVSLKFHFILCCPFSSSLLAPFQQLLILQMDVVLFSFCCFGLKMN